MFSNEQRMGGFIDEEGLKKAKAEQRMDWSFQSYYFCKSGKMRQNNRKITDWLTSSCFLG